MEGFLLLTSVVAGLGGASLDTVFVLGSRSVDLTGDGRPEIVEVVAEGESMDSLDLTLSIRSDGNTIFNQRLSPLEVFLGGTELPEERQSRLEALTAFFLNEEKFMSPGEFVAWLESSLPRHVERIPEVIAEGRTEQGVLDAIAPRVIWEDMKERGNAIFQFATGGDGITAIGWSVIDERFFHLLECC